MEILNNPWVTGIGGGIISSLIVFFVTKYFFSKRENREYLQKIETANNEILYSIRPLIIEKKLPSIDILLSIRISIAKKYGIKQEDLYNNFSLSNDLITEIMGNSFLSSEQKIEFCNLLELMKMNERKDPKEVEVIYLNKKNSISSKYSSMLLAMSSFAMVLTTTLFVTKEATTDTSSFFGENISLLLISTTVPIMAMIITLLYRILKEKERKNQDVKATANSQEEK